MNKIATYFRGVISELRKVQWPTPRTVAKHFFAVVLGIGMATAIIGAFDYIFIHGLSLIIK